MSGAGSAARTLARAFADDPLVCHVLPDPATRPRRLRWLYGRALAHARRHGGVAELDGGAGAACWLPTARLRLSPLDLLRSGLVAAPLRLGPGATWRLEGHESAVLERVLPRSEGSACLWLLGVDPQRRGQGLGRRTVEAVLDVVAPSYRRCVLWTEQPRNVGLYEHLGFEVVESFRAVPSGLQVWICERPLA